MAVYSWNVVQQTVPVGTNQTLFLLPNPNRVSLLISSPTGAIIRVSNLFGASVGIWYFLFSDNYQPLTFRDFGPPVKDAIYLSHTAVSPQVIVATEIYKIGAC